MKEIIPKRIQNKFLTASEEFKKQFIYNSQEEDKEGLYDPIYDQVFQQAPQLIHRHKNRVLFLGTNKCGILCRFCFRKNTLNEKDHGLYKKDFNQTLSYLRQHSEIEELIFTGGDPLTFTNDELKFFLTSFSEISSLNIIRFHTRMLVTHPKRINQDFKNLLKKFDSRFQFVFVFHLNHPEDLDEESYEAVNYLKNYILLSQSVLLKGVNNQVKILVNLFKKISNFSIKPYYLHHPDQVQGAMHFYLSISEGRKLYQSLFKELSGWMIPQYVLDLPQGKGKTPLYNPESFHEPEALFSFTGEKTPLTKIDFSRINLSTRV